MAIDRHNLFLEMLPKKLRSKFESAGQLVELESEDVLLERDEEVSYIYFPFSGYVSLLAPVHNHPDMEMTLIGNEGILGSTLSAGITASAFKEVVQGAGCALRIERAVFQKELLSSARLRSMTGRYLSLLLAQTANTAICTSFHSVRQRLAKRLLTTHDRAEADSFHSTHQTLADMLGVRRSAISIAAGLLQEQNCISYSRGNITIIDRKALAAEACCCYKQIKH